MQRLAEARGVELKRHGADLHRAVPVPRGPRALAGHQPEEESVALPGRVPGRRLGDRLGHAAAGRELPPRGRAAAGRASSSSRRPRAKPLRKRSTDAGSCRRRSRPDADDQRALSQVVELLPRHAEAEPGGAEVPGGARPAIIRR